MLRKWCKHKHYLHSTRVVAANAFFRVLEWDEIKTNFFFSILVNSRTLPHPRHNTHVVDPRARDDQVLGKGYLPSPSPALPLDGSYYNMNSYYNMVSTINNSVECRM